MTTTAQRHWTFRLSTLFALTFVVAIVFGLIAGVRRLLPADPRGPVEQPELYPFALREMLEDAAEHKIEPGPCRVYCLAKSWTSYYCWQMKGSPELISLITERWELKPGTALDVATFWRGWPDHWIKLNPANAYQCLGNYTGQKGRNFVVMVDASSDDVYVFFMDNF